MATEMKPEKSEPVSTGLKSDPTSKLAEHEGASSSGKEGILSVSTFSISSTGDANSSNKREGIASANIKIGNDQELVGEHGAYNLASSNYNYYYPGYSGSLTQVDDHGYFQADGSHTAMQSDSGSLVYYMPGYNPYASGTVVGVDGQSVSQHPFFTSSYLQHVPYGSEAVPCYSWDSTYVGDVPNGNAVTGNGRYGSGSKAVTKLNGLSSMKVNGNSGTKFSKSTYPQPLRPLNKVSPLDSDFSASILKGYQPTGKFSSFTGQKQGLVSHSGPMNYGQNGRNWNANNRYKSRDRYQRSGDLETSPEMTCGPRASNRKAQLDSSVKKEDSGFTVHRDKYNQADFETEYVNAKFYVIKSYSEDDIHKSIKYDVWASTPNGNKKLDAAFQDAESKSSKSGTKCPVFLFFSVNGSGQFVGLAEMVGQVDFNKDMDFWQVDKWNGFFPVKWHVVKDIPNNKLWHIILENNECKAVTFSRDTQEIKLKQGLEMLNIFKNYTAKTSLLDDFNFYEIREKSIHARKTNKPATLRMEINETGDLPRQTKAGERKFDDDSKTKKITNPPSLINLTKNLSLNGYNPKSNPVTKRTENSVPAVAAP